MEKISTCSVRRLMAAALLLAPLLASPGLAAPAQDGSDLIPWKPGLTFSRTSVEDDVRSVLRAVLSADGLSVIFRPGVEGKVSFNFRNMPLQAAFDQLIQENGLRVAYNADRQTVTVMPGGAGAADGRRFITLQNVEWTVLRQMLTSFGIPTEGVSYDPNTSIVSVSGNAALVAQVEDLVNTLERHYTDRREQEAGQSERALTAQRSSLERQVYQDAMNVQTRVFRLRFADVGPTTRNFHGRTVTIPGVLETLQSMLGTNTQSPPFATQAMTGTPFRPAVPVSPGSPLRQALPGQQSEPGGASRSGEAAFASIGKPNISIDQRTNSVVVRGSPAAIAAVADVLRQIDQPVKMVEIEVIIATAELGVVNELGIAYRGSVRNGVGFDTGTTGSVIGQTPGYNALTLLPAAAAGSTVASFVLNGSGTSLQAQLQALASKNKARVLSAPHLVTLDNITARITRSEDIYVPVDTGGLNGQGLAQIQTGLTLEITPSIVPPAAGTRNDQLVRLTLNATNSSPGSGTGSRINVNSQEVQTDVLVPDGGTFVIGGLFDDSRLSGQSGIPVLKDIPLLGHLFRTDTAQQSLGQTIFFITPRIVEQQSLVNRDVALDGAVGNGTARYMDTQRRRLGGMAQEMHGGPVRLSAALEEDQ